MKITILTLFPEMFTGPLDYSIIQRAKEKGLVSIEIINIRDFGIGTHKIVDDTPYGGGIGMVLKVDVLHEAIDYAKQKFSKQTENKELKQLVILMSASGKLYKQSLTKEGHTTAKCRTPSFAKISIFSSVYGPIQAKRPNLD